MKKVDKSADFADDRIMDCEEHNSLCRDKILTLINQILDGLQGNE
jgi:hypothetical protein